MSAKPLWAPWRMQFLTDPDGKGEKSGCVFCNLVNENQDRKNLIVYRAKSVFLILNKYPYNNGHLMVVPYQHTADLSTLSKEEMTEMMEQGQACVEALKATYHPEGFNLGMNIGASGGAGIRDHLHLHVVPRWTGDTNFMPVLADTKSMPQHLGASFEQLHSYFEK